jgi:hypothetical protein
MLEGQDLRKDPTHIRLFKPISADAFAGHPRAALTAKPLPPARLGWFSQTQPMPRHILQSGSGTPCPRCSVSAKKFYTLDGKPTRVVRLV